MKKVSSLFFILFLSTFSYVLQAQQESSYPNTTYYQAEAFGSVASGDNTPFWMVSNRYGKVPLSSGNGYFSPAIFHNQRFGKGFYWNAGIEMVASAPRYRNVYLQQLYAEIGYKWLRLSIGSKENYFSLWDKQLSSGDMVHSANARPIPEINISIPDFVAFPGTKGWFHLKGDFALGRSFDTDYLKDFVKTNQDYVEKVLWHHKSLHFRIKDSRNNFPLFFDLGVQHWAQWGGTSTRDGKQPQSLKDLVRVIVGKEGGAGATESDQINVLGNHYGSYDFRIGFDHPEITTTIYHQRFFEDKSGIEFQNGWDGLWGLQIDLKNFPWLKKFVLETIETRDQTGPFHFLGFDHDEHPGRGGGADNYYNNGEYRTGASYFNRALGSALIPSPEYNTDGSLGFKNNRVKDWHIAAEGNIMPEIDYRVLLTFMNSWGTHYAPFRNKKTATAFLLDIRYSPKQLSGWSFTGSLAIDGGDMFNDKGAGFSLGVKKSGILKKWD